MDKIRTLIVDDSAFMRKSLQIMLESDDRIEIIETARDGLQAVELVKKLRPDVVTLDIEMPKMDGLSALKIIMKECPTSIIMVSSLTSEGAEATLKAMELGAVDFIPKELSYVNVNIHKIKDEIISKVVEIGRQSKLKNRLRRIVSTTKKLSHSETKPGAIHKTIPKYIYSAIALGISTGGPLSLQKVIPLLSEKINIPIFIVQHMPPKFTNSLAERLNTMSSLMVKEAENGEVVKGGTIYIAPGGKQMVITALNGGSKITISDKPDNTLHKPSVDVMMNSVINVYGKATLGIIMTGMGKDGLEAITKLKSIGGIAVAQDEETSIVYGMPKAIVDNDLADSVIPLEKFHELINYSVVKYV